MCVFVYGYLAIAVNVCILGIHMRKCICLFLCMVYMCMYVSMGMCLYVQECMLCISSMCVCVCV